MRARAPARRAAPAGRRRPRGRRRPPRRRGRAAREARSTGERPDLGPGERRDRPRDRVLARVLGRAGEPHAARAVDALGGDDVGDPHPPFGHRPRLVEHDRRDLPCLLEDLGALDQDPELGAAAGADHQRGRRRETERARAGDDQHRDGGGEGRADIAGEHEPADERRERDRDHDGHEDGGDPVDETLDRRLACLRLGDETGDLRQRRVGADLRRLDDEAAGGVDRRACDNRRPPPPPRAPAPRSASTGRPRRPRRRRRRRSRSSRPAGRRTGRRRRAPRSARAPRRRRAGRARPSRRARAARGSPRRSGGGRGPRGSGRAGSAS